MTAASVRALCGTTHRRWSAHLPKRSSWSPRRCCGFPLADGTATGLLTPPAAANWRPLDGVRVFTRPRSLRAGPADRSTDIDDDVEPGDRVVVRLTSTQVAHLDSQAATPAWVDRAPAPTSADRSRANSASPHPKRDAGQQQILQRLLPTGRLSTVRSSGRRLIPVPVSRAAGQQLATSLIAGFARGAPRTSAP